MSGKYDYIINLPHHRSTVHPHMLIADRAAQFSPFAALTGYEAAIKETGRLTGQKTDLSDDTKLRLDEQLHLIQSHITEHLEVSITYFIPDTKKSGGRYETIAGAVKKINKPERIVVMQNQTRIPIDDILEITMQNHLTIT